MSVGLSTSCLVPSPPGEITGVLDVVFDVLALAKLDRGVGAHCTDDRDTRGHGRHEDPITVFQDEICIFSR